MSEQFQSQLLQLGDTDYVVRGTAADGMVRGFAAITKKTVQAAKDAHGTSPVATAALGRLLTAGAMMGSMLKDPGELISLIVNGDGPIAGLTVTADSEGHVKGYAGNPDVWLEPNAAGKLDVGGAIGMGTLTVVQDMPWGEPYCSQLGLVSGEIGDDIGAYYVESEQIPTSVGLGVFVDRDMNVKHAGGFIVQAMPGCTEEVLSALEANLAKTTSVTTMLEQGMTPQDILSFILDGLGFEPLEATATSFKCNCSRERTEKVIISLGAEQIREIADEGKPTELVCSFCSSKYVFSPEDLYGIIDEMSRPN